MHNDKKYYIKNVSHIIINITILRLNQTNYHLNTSMRGVFKADLNWLSIYVCCCHSILPYNFTKHKS